MNSPEEEVDAYGSTSGERCELRCLGRLPVRPRGPIR